MKNNINLATTTSITTSYSGDHAQEYVSAALLSANSLEQGGFTIIPNVKWTHTLNNAATGSLLKDATCDFDASSSVTLTEKVLTVKKLNVNLQVCKNDFQTSWNAAQMGFSEHQSLPKSFSDFLLGHVIGDVAAEIETLIWSGTSTVAGEIGGIETEIALDAALPAAQEVAGTTTTVGNIIAQLRLITAVIPNRVYGKEGLRLYLSTSMVKNYIGALGGHVAAGVGGSGTNDQGTQWYTNGSLTFDGIEIFMAKGMSTDVGICTYKDNLIFASSVMSDMSDVKVIDMSPTDGSENVRVVMKMAAVASYRFPQDIVTYGITNGAN